MYLLNVSTGKILTEKHFLANLIIAGMTKYRATIKTNAIATFTHGFFNCSDISYRVSSKTGGVFLICYVLFVLSV